MTLTSAVVLWPAGIAHRRGYLAVHWFTGVPAALVYGGLLYYPPVTGVILSAVSAPPAGTAAGFPFTSWGRVHGRRTKT
jgi:hypothetical protein